jgi:iron(III) transport system ATP-binding protein
VAPYLQLRGVSKRFGAFVALEGIDLEVARGQLVCLLGPSGCGKTTLLRIIAGLEWQDAGELWQDGRDISRLPPARRDFGIVFQSYALFPNLTAAENVAYGLESRGRRRAEARARVAELLELVGLSEIGHRYPAQLSGGQQQRVALARALALSPGLLLLDEPLAALDARVRAGLREELRMLQRRLGVTMILVTHDQEEALALADRLVVLEHGRIVQSGTPLEVYRAPVTRFVADFVGLMNFIPSPEGGALGIRPEDVELWNMDPGEGDALRGRIESVTFLGSFWRVRLRPDGGQPALLADVPAAAARSLALRPGEPAWARLPAERVRQFPDGGRG